MYFCYLYVFLVEKDELPMREYQYELSQVATNGENTIICAPTGSGKTRVALYIVRDHLSKTFDHGTCKISGSLIIIYRHGQDFLCLQVCHVTGESELSMQLHTVFDFYDIFVLTPQILDNHLKDGRIKSLSEFSLLILDECHHTRKGEPYNNLMKKYLKAKKAREDGLPQIIGLTASLGVEKATTVGEATISILKLCANLDVRKLSTVTVYKDELERTVPKPDERRVKLHGNRCDEARDQIHNTMLQIENHLDEAKKRPSDLNSQSYGQWAVEIRRSAMKIIGQTLEKKALTRTIVVYNASMDIHDLVRLSDVLEYLEKTLTDNLEKNKHSPVEAKLSTYFKELKLNLRRFAIEDENPNLRILKDEIIKLRKEKGDDSLGIIFVRTRGTCSAICEWMKSDRELRRLNAEPFTGAGAHEEEGGMTQNQQDAAIARFRSGTTKFLVATSVAEEGLDIPDCNIVIRYNHVGNEITTVQTRGRSRKRGGTSVLLGMDEILKREILNIGKSKMMEQAILQFKQMPLPDVKKQIKEYQKAVIQEEQLKEEISKLSQRNKINDRFQLVCFKCTQLKIDNKFIKTINNSHHVVIDPEFMLKVDLRPDQSPRKPFDGIQITGKIHCKKCHNHLGVMFRYKGLMFPAVRVESFQILTSSGQIMLLRKWKDLPFLVKEIGQEDYKRMISREKEAQNPEQPDNDAILDLTDLRLDEENSEDEDSDFVFVKERFRDKLDEKDVDETDVKYP
ncbi:hypothetical protein LOTGIDRAFT_142329 [Lottia gigantea]|uniref:RNA helicase n=1 Tax=Lottia gigantea TaxID=225164 RepID=V4CB32_LOTGI|nr:hypothetical protein LOTGIDRAFT_142329 [Lottia gigantea]ESO99044.1 hypothetical protein LOTGIDRAFT_142329 [Lottia gigantea]